VRTYGFLTAQKLAREEWHAWAVGEAEKARLLAEARQHERATRHQPVGRGIVATVAALRLALGAVLIGAGRRIQGAAPVPLDTAGPTSEVHP
jgi:hypothetical protein